MSVTSSAVLAVARREIGTVESPHGSNRVKYTEWYGMGAVPWCAIFISWVAAVAKATDIIPRHAYTPSGVAWFKSRGRFGRTPRVGAIVYYQFPGFSRVSHVGIVETVHSDGSWTAIEGNTDSSGSRTGGQVMRKRRRSIGRLGGFGYPDYSTPSLYSKNPTARWQALLKFAPWRRDGEWGPVTDKRSQRMATAGRNADNYAVLNRYSARSTIRLLQRIVGTPDDGVWGPASARACHEWVKKAQAMFGVTVDGEWGPKTQAAYAKFRAANLHNY